MRADRLISLSLLLQEHGKLSASHLARRLEVSVRTIFRDMEALSMAGIPVFAHPGSKGGFSLVDNYRTDLTGLKAEEILALFLLEGSKAALLLGLEKQMGSAIRKLSAALPHTQRERIDWYRQRFLIESDTPEAGRSFGTRAGRRSADLSILQQAILNRERLKLRIVWPRPDQAGEYVVAPLALVESAGEWNLVAQAGAFVRVYPAEFVADALPAGRKFERPASFDLPSFWKKWRKALTEHRAAFKATLEISPAVARSLDARVDEDVVSMIARQAARHGDRARLTVTFPYLAHARDFVLAHGSAVKVIGPVELRSSVIDHARRTLGQYE